METIKLKYPEVKNYVGGKAVNSSSTRAMDVLSPLDGTVISTGVMSNQIDFDKAVENAKLAFANWSKVPIKERVQVFFKYKTLLEKHRDELAELVHIENGKTKDEDYAEVDKSVELTEFACSLPQLISGELLEVEKAAAAAVAQQSLRVPNVNTAELHLAPPRNSDECIRMLRAAIADAKVHYYRLTNHPLIKFFESLWLWLIALGVFKSGRAHV